MSIFRPAILAAFALACASPAALAAPTAPPARERVPHRRLVHMDPAKKAACEAVWAAQKVRHGAHAAFVAACVAKG